MKNHPKLNFKLLMRLLPLFAVVSMLSATAAQAFDVPKLTGPVMDLADIVDASTEQKLADTIRRIHNRGLAQIQVLTVPNLGGEPIENVSIQITDQWKLGTKDQDNGILLLISRDDRELRIEVGQGLEGTITDLHSRRIIDRVIVPLFREGNFSAGIANGVHAIISRIAPAENASGRDADFAYETVPQRGPGTLFRYVIFGFIWFFVFVSVLFRIGRRFRGHGGWYGGGWGSGGGWSGGGGWGSSGGGWSGGGGGFSGGGASGRW